MCFGGIRVIALLCCFAATATADPSLHPKLPPDPLHEEALARAASAEREQDFETAHQQYMTVIDDFEAASDDWNTALVSPLIGLARASIKLGDYAGAEQALRRAQHIIHRNDGVHTLEQLEVIDVLTELQLEADEPLDADRQQQFAMYLSERNFGADSIDLLPSLARLTDWYIDTGQFRSAHNTIDRSVEIIAANGNDDDLRLIPALLKRAKVTRLAGNCCSYRDVEAAKEIVDAAPDVPADTVSQVYEALADAYIASSKEDLASHAYAKVAETLGQPAANETYAEPVQIARAENLRAATDRRVFIAGPDEFERQFRRDFYFDSALNRNMHEVSARERLFVERLPPQSFLVPDTESRPRIHINERYSPSDAVEPVQEVIGEPFLFMKSQLRQILPLSRRQDSELAKLFVTLEFTVGSDGQVSDINVTDGNAPNRVERLMREVLYKSRFRPRIVDGVPVSTHNHSITQTFKP